MFPDTSPRSTRGAAIALAITVVFVIPVACKKKEGPSEAPPVAVETEKVQVADVTRPFVLFGRTEPLADAMLSFLASGVVEKIAAKEGQKVVKGQLLAALDKESLQLNVQLSRARLAQASVTYSKFRKGYRKESVQQAYAQYKQAQAQFAKARADWESGQKLRKAQTISQNQYLAYKANFESAKARLEQAKQGYQMYLKGYQKEDVQTAGVQASQAQTQLKMAKKQLRDAELRAPFTGVIARKQIEVGELVSAQRQAFQLMDLRKLEIKVGVPERIIDDLRVGQTAFINLSASERVSLRQMIVGKITVKGVSLDKTTMTYPVTIVISNPVIGGTKTRPTYKLLPGKVARVVLFSQDRKRGITLPLAAVLNDGSQTFVYVNEKKTAKKVAVTPGHTYRNRIVVQGLKPGTEVVVKGMHRLSPGRRLFVVRTGAPVGLSGPIRQEKP